MLRLEIPKIPTKKLEVTNTFDKIQFFIFDFDLTLTDTHIYHLLDSEKTQLVDLAEPPFKNKEVCKNLKEIFEFLYKHNKIILIASRNYNDVIYYYIRQNVYPNFSLLNIFSDRQWFFKREIVNMKQDTEGKLKAFSMIHDLQIPMNQVFYIDDSYQEIRNVVNLYPDIQYYWKPEDKMLTLELLKSFFFKQ